MSMMTDAFKPAPKYRLLCFYSRYRVPVPCGRVPAHWLGNCCV